ncbi:MAG: methyltransferase domain-containing protein [Bacteroidetes bacterium]|nr:methyltransferase domain-containing protein [Bacteroidota bacterium]
MEQKEWFASWFDTSYYHQLYNNRNEDEAKLFISNLLDFLKLDKNAKLLDLACGKGRHAKTLNEFGYDVLGVDLSPNSISIASELKNEHLNFQVHDMREPIHGKTFDAVFNLFTSFGYFDETTDNERVCNAIAKMLNPHGILVIDFMNAKKVIANLVSKEEKTVDYLTFHITRQCDGKHIFKRIQFEDQGEKYDFTERVQALKLNDFQTLLAAEFQILHTFGTFDLKPFDPSISDRLIIIAQRK